MGEGGEVETKGLTEQVGAVREKAVCPKDLSLVWEMARWPLSEEYKDHDWV